MKITSIKQQVKRAGRYSIFVDGSYAFSLSEVALLKSQLASGQEMTREQLGEWKHESVDDKLYNQALRYCAMRPRSVWEMQTYLKRKEAAPTLEEIILNKLSDLNLLNDEAFARAWVANRRLLKPVSRRRLQQELRAKRVVQETIDTVLNEDETDEKSVLAELIERKRKQTKYQDDQKLMQYLARQGFNYGDIKNALSE